MGIYITGLMAMNFADIVNEINGPGSFWSIFVLTIVLMFSSLYIGIGYYVYIGILPSDTSARLLIVQVFNLAADFVSSKILK